MKRVIGVCLGIGLTISLGMVMGGEVSAATVYKAEEITAETRFLKGDGISFATYLGYGPGEAKEWFVVKVINVDHYTMECNVSDEYIFPEMEDDWEYRATVYENYLSMPGWLRSCGAYGSDGIAVMVEPLPVINKQPESTSIKKGEAATFEAGIDPMYTTSSRQPKYQWHLVETGPFKNIGFVDNGDGSWTATGKDEAASLSFYLGEDAVKVGDVVSYKYRLTTPQEQCSFMTRTFFFGRLKLAGVEKNLSAFCGNDEIQTASYTVKDTDVRLNWNVAPVYDGRFVAELNVGNLPAGETLTISDIVPEITPDSGWTAIPGATSPTLTLAADSPYLFDGARYILEVNGRYDGNVKSDVVSVRIEEGALPTVPGTGGGEMRDGVVVVGAYAVVAGVMAGIATVVVGLRRVLR